MSVYLQDPDVTLYHGDVLEQLNSLPDESVHCVVTSPPYWGLRSYLDDGHADKPSELGLEPTPDLYIERMVQVFREVRRVLRRDGVCFLNIGDSYLPGKQMAGVPWRLLFALQDDGWIPRADIIWSKPNPMPESVTDRPTKAHEYVFLLTRSAKYFFDQEAVREPHNPAYEQRRGTRGMSAAKEEAWENGAAGIRDITRYSDGVQGHPAGRNVRSVWTIATEAFPEAHFATFPTELARRCILAGTSERGCCPECGAPWVREVEVTYRVTPGRGPTGTSNRPRPEEVGFRPKTNLDRMPITTGWRPSCDCERATTRLVAKLPRIPIPCTVLDPFVGSGTVPHVARLHNRHAIGIDLNADYLQLAARRLQQQSLFASSSTEGAV